jgi:hypothetical protein
MARNPLASQSLNRRCASPCHLSDRARVTGRVEKPWVANQGMLKSKELIVISPPCLTLMDFHEVSRAAGPK